MVPRIGEDEVVIIAGNYERAKQAALGERGVESCAEKSASQALTGGERKGPPVRARQYFFSPYSHTHITRSG